LRRVLSRSIRQRPGNRGAPSGNVVPTPEPWIPETILESAEGSAALLTLYPGFLYFTREFEGCRCVIPYVANAAAWVGASIPVAPPELRARLVGEFFAAARAVGKVGVVLPVSARLAVDARARGMRALQIGEEPWFDLTTFDAERFLRALPVARRLKEKGATVEAFDPFQLTERDRLELDLIVERWLESRSAVPLSFLNRVEPWQYVGRKRYFRLMYHGHAAGMLAAVPVPGRRGWYFADLLRSPGAPVGTTEWLVIQAMAKLREEGFSEVTLGLAALVQVTGDERKNAPRGYSVMDAVSQKLEAFYGFGSLLEYKRKFPDGRWEPVFILSPGDLGMRSLYGLFCALFPRGVAWTLGASLWRKIRDFNPGKLLRTALSERLVPRSAPDGWVELLVRCRVTLGIAVVQVLFFLASVDRSGLAIRPAMEGRYSFSPARMVAHGVGWDDVSSLIVSSFLHWNSLHLAFNLVLLVFAVGWLELIAGSAIVGVTYLIGILVSNPIVSIILYVWLWFFHPSALPLFVNESDVGCSLGVFCSLGALAFFLKRSRVIVALASAGIVASSVMTMSLLSLNHLPALVIGLFCGRLYARKS
jgi:membrane associated rhomboid family serine protease